MNKYFLRLVRLFTKLKMLKDADVYTSANPLEIDLPPGEKFLVIAPHPDDEIIGAGGLILKLLKNGRNAVLFYNKISDEIRRTEAQSVCASLKVSSVFTQSYFRNELKDYLKRNSVDTIILPNIIDNHRDHFQTVTDVYHILKSYTKTNYKILLYEIWTPHQPNIVIDITDEFDGKIKLINIYQSQLHNKNYDYTTAGLNAYRTVYLKSSKGYAESFILLHNTNDFIKLYESLIL